MKKTRNELIKMLEANTLEQPKAKYSNEVIIKMLKCTPSTFAPTVEYTRGKKVNNGISPIFNRGSLVECIIKWAVIGEKNIVSSGYNYQLGTRCNNSIAKSKAFTADLVTSDLSNYRLKLINGLKSNNIEIKFTTSFAPATYNNSGSMYTILVSTTGIYLIESKNIIYTPAGKLNINNQRHKDLTPLTELMKKLGFIDKDDKDAD